MITGFAFATSTPVATAKTANPATAGAAPDSVATATAANPATPASERSRFSQISRSHRDEVAPAGIGAALKRACAGADLEPADLLAAMAEEEIEVIGTDELPLAALTDLAAAMAATRARAAGRVPKGWIKVVTCAGCGPVWLWRGAPDTVEACPWCHERHQGRPVPRPRRVACATCSRFVPDPLGDGGIGTCEIDIPLTEPPRFPFAPRGCAWWLPKEC